MPSGSSPAAPASSGPEDASAPAVEASGAPVTGAAADSGSPKDAGKAGQDKGKDAGSAGKDAGSKAGVDPAVKDAGSGDPLAQGTDAGPAGDSGLPVLAAPVPGSADAVAADIDAIYVGKKTFSARFKQEHTQKVSGAVKKSQGVVFVEKPNKISFRYDPPNRNRIVSDGKTLRIYLAEDEQMFVQPVEKTEYPGALAFLMGRGLRPSFTFAIHDKAKFEGGPVLLGTPRVPTPYYENVIFYIDKALLAKSDPGTVRRVLILDAQGNKNRFDFEGASQPQSIDPAEFTFSPPAGTQITQQ
jgi:outer membrane lipoprotein-sorting protein